MHVSMVVVLEDVDALRRQRNSDERRRYRTTALVSGQGPGSGAAEGLFRRERQRLFLAGEVLTIVSAIKVPLFTVFT